MLRNASHTAMWSALQAGDKNALLLIYQHFYIDFMNFGLRLTGDRGLTSDCITQSLLHLWDKRASLPPVTNLRPYLLTCLRHQIYATLRSDSRRVAHALAAHRFDATIEQSMKSDSSKHKPATPDGSCWKKP